MAISLHERDCRIPLRSIRNDKRGTGLPHSLAFARNDRGVVIMQIDDKILLLSFFFARITGILLKYHLNKVG